MKDGRLARPSAPTLPGTPGTIARQGPAVRPGRLGTLPAVLANEGLRLRSFWQIARGSQVPYEIRSSLRTGPRRVSIPSRELHLQEKDFMLMMKPLSTPVPLKSIPQ